MYIEQSSLWDLLSFTWVPTVGCTLSLPSTLCVYALGFEIIQESECIFHLQLLI